MSDTEHVFLLWDCKDCGQKAIPCSPDKNHCPSCGEVRTFAEFDQAYLPGDNDTWEDHHHHRISEETWERLSNAGASWFCVVCYADNYGDLTHCHHCDTKRGATDEELRDDTSYESFVAFMDGDQGASADLVETFGEYAGMRAAHGESFNMEDSHDKQLERANEGRSAFQSERNAPHPSRPVWEDSDLPSSVESMKRTHGSPSEAPRIFSQDLEGTNIDEDRKPEKEGLRSRISNFWDSLKEGFRKFKLWISGILVSLGIVSGGVWGMQTYEVQGEIKALHWERTIQEYAWTPIVKEDWRKDLRERTERQPRNGRGERAGIKILSCRDKHHHYEQYQCGTKEVSCTHMESYQEDYSCTKYRTESYSCEKSKTESYSCGTYQCHCSTSRNSNGTASRSCSTCTKTCTRNVTYSSTCTKEVPYDSTCTRTKKRPIHGSDTVPKYCDRSIKKSYCDYQTQHWANSDRYYLEGEDLPAKWPKGSLTSLEKEVKSESYEIVFEYSDDGIPETYTKSVSHRDLKKLKVGQKVTFTVTNFGTVQSYRIGHIKEQL